MELKLELSDKDKIDVLVKIVHALAVAVECQAALDYPHKQGLEVLKFHGFDSDNISRLSGSAFALGKMDYALFILNRECVKCAELEKLIRPFFLSGSAA